MARRANPLRAQIRALAALVKADKAEQRAAERPVREARRRLKARLDSPRKAVDRYNQIIADGLYNKGRGWFSNPYKLEAAERSLADATATFKSRLADLMAYDLVHNIEGADYPTLPVLDRESTIAAGKADYERSMAEVRARYERPTVQPRNPRDTIFADIPEPDYQHPRLR